MCWMIFFATSRSFIPETWNEQSSPQSLQQKTCISIASYELQHYPLRLLNKCKAMTQCRPAAYRLNYLSFQRQRVSGTITGMGITKIPGFFSHAVMMRAGPVNKNQYFEECNSQGGHYNLPLKKYDKRYQRRSLRVFMLLILIVRIL